MKGCNYTNFIYYLSHQVNFSLMYLQNGSSMSHQRVYNNRTFIHSSSSLNIKSIFFPLKGFRTQPTSVCSLPFKNTHTGTTRICLLNIIQTNRKLFINSPNHKYQMPINNRALEVVASKTLSAFDPSPKSIRCLPVILILDNLLSMQLSLFLYFLSTLEITKDSRRGPK